MTPSQQIKLVLTLLAAAVIVIWFRTTFQSLQALPSNQFWPVQSIDTMKYSRDLARQALNDPSFDQVIDQQMSQIASTGANYVGIGTPYDQEFVPILKRWVLSARKYHLNVWFRGNFSGWEGWFGYLKITRADHLALTRSFIIKNKDLFENGDIFTSCPECENGGPRDPRQTGDVSGFRQFMISELKTTLDAFSLIHKRVTSNYFSMNMDVALLVMDKDTTKALGGVITVDHYVSTPEKLVSDISDLAQNSQARIVLGEFGAPIPDLNGNLDDAGQAAFIQRVMAGLIKVKQLIGINYWVNVGGTTQLWTTDGLKRPVVDVLANYYKPHVISGYVKDELGIPIKNVQITDGISNTSSNQFGSFALFHPGSDSGVTIEFKASGYNDQNLNVSDSQSMDVTLIKNHGNIFYSSAKLFINLFHH